MTESNCLKIKHSYIYSILLTILFLLKPFNINAGETPNYELEQIYSDSNLLPHWLEGPYGDINRNRIVDEDDLPLFFDYWLDTNDITDINDADYNGDGIVNSHCYSLLAANWKKVFTQPESWEAPVGGPSEHPIIKNNKVYVPADGLYILNSFDGTVLSHYLEGNWYCSAPVIDNTGFIHAYSYESGKIYKIDEEIGPLDSIDIGSIDVESLTYDILNNRLIVMADPTTGVKAPWSGIALSSTGQYQTAIANSGYIYISSNYGKTWTAKSNSLPLSGVAVSETGQYQTATDWDNGRIYTSDDYGETWSIKKDSGPSFRSVDLSSSGQYQTTVAVGEKIYVSNDYGETWSPKDTNRNWTDIALSSSGQYQTAVVNGGYIYTSNDYGNNWTAEMSDLDRNWSSTAISSNGQYQTAAISNGYIYLSNDYGKTWTAKMTDSDRNWRSVAMSSDGKYLTAVNNFYAYVSSDNGNTWSEKAGITYYSDISISSDGKYQTAVADNKYIHLSSNYGTGWLIPGILAISADNYEIVWSNFDISTIYGQSSMPIIVGDFIYARSNVNGILLKIRLNNGSTLTLTNLPGTGSGYSCLIYDSDHCYIYAFDKIENNVYAVDANSLDLIWTRNLGNNFELMRTSSYHNSKLIVPSRQSDFPYASKLFALDVDNYGEILWTNNTAFDNNAELVNGVMDDEFIYIPTHDYYLGNYNMLLVINIEDGTLYKSYSLPSASACSALTASGGNFIVGLWDTEATLMIPVRQGGAYWDSLYKIDNYRTGYLGDRVSGFFW